MGVQRVEHFAVEWSLTHRPKAPIPQHKGTTRVSPVRLCDPVDYTGHGILQARMLEGELFPSPRDLPNPGIEPRSPALQADALPAEPQGKPTIG